MIKYFTFPLSLLALSIQVQALPATSAVASTAPMATTATSTLPQAYDIPTSRPRLQDDFYTYINYDYLKNSVLPADKAQVNNFTDLDDKNKKTIKALFSDLNQHYATLSPNSDDKKVIDYYNMAYDFNTRDKLGIAPVQNYLNKVKAVTNQSQMNQLMQDFFLLNYSPLINIQVSHDQKNSQTNILYISPPDTGISKTYLEGKDDFSIKIQNAYKTYMQKIFEQSGYAPDQAKAKSDLVFNFEKQLASTKMTPEQELDLAKQYNVMTLAQVQKMTPNLPILAIMKQQGLDKANKIVVLEPKTLKQLNSLADGKNLDAMKAQTEFQIVNKNAQRLSKDIYKTYMDYFSAYTGLNYIEPDDDLAYNATNGKLGELVGKLYVAKNFSPNTKADVINMTKKLRDIYKQRMDAVDWLSPATKRQAQKKLDNLVIKIGYPDKWHDYSQFNVKPYSEGGDLVQAADQLTMIEAKRELAKLNKPTDRTEWNMNPQDINAYYNPANNEIVFPAGILQAPFYSPSATYAQNLGGVGTIIGHELSHGFDRTGSQYDEKGNMKNWWTKKDAELFQKKVKQAADIYSKLEVVPSYHINGEISTGEILADLGGVTVALNIAEKEKIDQKQVMESYARAWRMLSTKEALISGIQDEHPPGKYRVNNILSQIDSFYSNYDIKPTDKMYVAPAERLKVW